MRSLVFLPLLFLAGCDYGGDFLVPKAVKGVPGIVDLGTLDAIPVGGVNPAADIAAATVYGEVGPTGTAEDGGVTFNFNGTGGTVCVWVDPELVTWNQSVKKSAGIDHVFSYPDNLYDDGDLDLFGGLTVYYQGSPGEDVGDFDIRWQDALGNEIPIQSGSCNILDTYNEPFGHSGRGHPEYCDIPNTEQGVNYTVLMYTWSTPQDDDRLGYGVFVSQGPCATLKATLGSTTVPAEECVIRGEAIEPEASDKDPLGPRARDLKLPGPNWVGDCQSWCASNPGQDFDGDGEVELRPTPPSTSGTPAEIKVDQERYNEELVAWQQACKVGCDNEGIDTVPSWTGSVGFEEAFCRSATIGDLNEYCEFEAGVRESCNWLDNPEPGERCYCGDPSLTPTGGAL